MFLGGCCSGGGSLHAFGDSTNFLVTCSCFPPARRGKCCPFFFILGFLCLVRCLLPFFAVFLFLGSLFEKIFGSELLCLGVGVGLVVFGGFLPMFLLYVLAGCSRNCLEKFS